MRVKLLTTISFFTYQLSISQTEKLLHGKVVSQNLILKNVEVINKTAKRNTKTNEAGEFEIAVNVNDSLLFFSKDFFFSRLKITLENIQTNNLLVNMIARPEELKEVVVLNKEAKAVWLTKEDIREIKLNAHKSKEGLQIAGYKEATMPNGVDFIYLGKRIHNLLKKEETPKKEIAQIDFRQLAKNTLNPDFFEKDLKLKPEEKELFLEFCDADPRSKTLLDNPNILATMDFLYAKNHEFKKLK
ncbi:hypothetical protein [Flavobacterium flavigenum]|uniref:hypothetical protein n=1 Tax=Flavobacterium flavigenum TaxID=3003258 RepID=UPI0022AC73C4|nr:hypothetical protein [Flavobacterium flavigenum]